MSKQGLFSFLCLMFSLALAVNPRAEALSCWDYFARVGRTVANVPSHFSQEWEFWTRWWNLRRLREAAEPPRPSLVERAVATSERKLRDWGQTTHAAITSPVASARQAGRYVSDVAVESYQMASEGLRTWATEMRQADGIWRRGLRLIVRERKPEELGQTSFWDFLRDPSGILQPHLVRRSLQTVLLGARIPPPRYTLTLPASIVGGGAVLGYLVFDPFERATNRPAARRIEDVRAQEIAGFRAFDAAYQAGYFADSASAYSALLAHDRALGAWLRRESPLFPGGFDYLAEGFFGPADAARVQKLRQLIESAAKENNPGAAERQLLALNAEEREQLRRILEFDTLLRRTYFDARKAASEDPNTEGFDTEFRRLLAARLGSHPLFGEGNYPAPLRYLLVDALNPKFSVQGESELVWEARAARAAADKDLATFPSEAIPWITYMDLRAQTLTQAPRIAAEYVGREMRRPITETERAERLRRARTIDSFCRQGSACEEKMNIIGRHDLPYVSEPLAYRTSTGTARIGDELDAWRLIYEDPAFLFFLREKMQGTMPHFQLLSDFRAYATALGEINELQARVFASARERGEPDWRTSASATIPIPGPKLFCHLLGYGEVAAGEPRSPNLIYAPVRVALEQIRPRMDRAQFLACRQLLSTRLWELQALNGEISRIGREARTTRERDRARAEMLAQIGDQEAVLQQTLERCVGGGLPTPPPAVQSELACGD